MLNGESSRKTSKLASKQPEKKRCVVQLKMKGMKIGYYFKAYALKVKSEHGYQMCNKTLCDCFEE